MIYLKKSEKGQILCICKISLKKILQNIAYQKNIEL